jgi:hypothetical protein
VAEDDLGERSTTTCKNTLCQSQYSSHRERASPSL